MYEAILFLPLIGALFAGFFGRLVGYRACEVVTITLMMVTAVLSWVAFYEVTVQGQDIRIELFEWIQSGDLSAAWAIRVDTLTAVMLVPDDAHAD